MEVERGAVRRGRDHGGARDHSGTPGTKRGRQKRVHGGVNVAHVREELGVMVSVGEMERFVRNGKIVSFFTVQMQYRMHLMSVSES